MSYNLCNSMSWMRKTNNKTLNIKNIVHYRLFYSSRLRSIYNVREIKTIAKVKYWDFFPPRQVDGFQFTNFTTTQNTFQVCVCVCVCVCVKTLFMCVFELYTYIHHNITYYYAYIRPRADDTLCAKNTYNDHGTSTRLQRCTYVWDVLGCRFLAMTKRNEYYRRNRINIIYYMLRYV